MRELPPRPEIDVIAALGARDLGGFDLDTAPVAAVVDAGVVTLFFGEGPEDDPAALHARTMKVASASSPRLFLWRMFLFFAAEVKGSESCENAPLTLCS